MKNHWTLNLQFKYIFQIKNVFILFDKDEINIGGRFYRMQFDT